MTLKEKVFYYYKLHARAESSRVYLVQGSYSPTIFHQCIQHFLIRIVLHSQLKGKLDLRSLCHVEESFNALLIPALVVLSSRIFMILLLPCLIAANSGI